MDVAQLKKLAQSVIQSLPRIPPSIVWMGVFWPAFLYFAVTRVHYVGVSLWGSSSLGELVTSNVTVFFSSSAADVGAAIAAASTTCQQLSSLFYIYSCDETAATATRTSQLSYGLYRVVGDAPSTPLLSSSKSKPKTPSPLSSFVSSTWRQDVELGRGYLLWSDAGNGLHNGRVWRWEVGGGPIAIGKTLHLDDAGCRSNQHKPCIKKKAEEDLAASKKKKGAAPSGASKDATGSGGIAIDFYNNDHYLTGRLVVAEWGEGRIVRLEENGARTPLVVEVPFICGRQKASTQRLETPMHLLYSPFGDLLFVDHFPDCGKTVLFQLKHAVHVPALPSLPASRRAHEWKSVEDRLKDEEENHIKHSTFYPALPEIMLEFDDKSASAKFPNIGGMTLSTDWTSLLVVARNKAKQIVLLRVPLNEEEEEPPKDPEPVPAKGKKGAAAQAPPPGAKHDILWDFSTTPELSALFGKHPIPGPIAMDRVGRVYLGMAGSVLVLDIFQKSILAQLHIGSTTAMPKSLSLGEDGFLYILTTNPSSLLRIPLRDAYPIKVPTNVVLRPTVKA